MRRWMTATLCASLVLLPAHRSALAAPASRTAEPSSGARRAGAPAPRPREYRLAEPTPEVKRRARILAAGGRALMITGITLDGLGLLSTIAGVVLVSLARGEGMQTAGVASLVSGVGALVLGTTLWALGRWRANKAKRLLLESRMRPYSLRPPVRPVNNLRAPRLPPARLVLTAQLRF